MERSAQVEEAISKAARPGLGTEKLEALAMWWDQLAEDEADSEVSLAWSLAASDLRVALLAIRQGEGLACPYCDA